MKKILPSLQGYIRVRVNGCACERFFNLCTHHQISLWDIKSCENTSEVSMKASDFLKLKAIVKKCHVKTEVTQKHGVPFFLKRHRKRRLFLPGFLCCCFFIHLLSLCIWRIDVNGNQELSRNTIISYLEEEEIRLGSRIKTLDCKKIAADLRNRFSVITWVSVEQTGTLLRITLQENADHEDPLLKSEDAGQPSGTENARTYGDSISQGADLIADYDGTVHSVLTRRGTALVKEGDAVKAGDILVSGELEIMDDNGELAVRHYTQADADVYLEISDSYTDQVKMEYTVPEYTGKQKKRYYLKILGHWFSALPSKDCYENQDLLLSENQICLPGEFYLPASLGTVTIREWKNMVKMYREEEAKALLNQRLEKFILEKQEKGVQIFKKNVRIETGVAFCRCVCDYQALVKCETKIPVKEQDPDQEGTVE